MPEDRDTYDWRVIGESVRGASHVRSELPNQDAIDKRPIEADAPLILAVSDGHGGAKYFRSHEGSQLAVQTAIDVLRWFTKSCFTMDNSARIQRSAQKSLPSTIVKEWTRRVTEHYSQDRITAEE